MKTKKMIYLSLLTSVGIVLGLFESIIPVPVPIPGAKLGLSNIVVLVTIITFGYREGLVVSVLKSIILVLVTGSFSAFIFSFIGAVLSSISMILADKYLNKYLSLIGVSLIGAFFHNFGQVLVASFILNNIMIFSYLPVLLILGLFTGYFVGITSEMVVTNLKKTIKENLE
ncbi:Gx transporter family protein [Anaerosphaera multitolerans]|uniref:Gx transporter family protein n=1 Tax=Anaerosphaera multitolerans TaxID=2487351 RepID=A0A437S7D0_9FIRM|nr:Gx transporter family protein [Anaerosphaera multitolerans]RVU54969.1 Gx transporter family protein [Anaerosphaera multitolerans]